MNNEKPSEQFVKRLISYYKTHTDSECLPIWTGVYGPLREWLTNEDIPAIQKKMETLYIDDLWGIDYNQQNSWKLRPYEQCFDSCLSIIAEDMDIKYESREHVISELERLLETELNIPEYPNRPTINVGKRRIPLRFLVCYFIFLRLHHHIRTAPKNVLEIGAGTGYFPYLFLTKYPSTKYNIVDLPIISVMQTYIYATMVGENNIWFHGEPKTDAQLRIFAPNTINDIEPGIDLTLNLNSFPEIPRSAQSAYLYRMREIMTDKGVFYSVNWEPAGIDQTPVVVACNNNGFQNIFRQKFPVESQVHSSPIDFFEEIYTP